MQSSRPENVRSAGEETSPAPVLILGAGKNVGLAMARKLVAESRPVILSYRRSPEDVVALQIEHPDLVRAAIPLDARTPGAVGRFFDKVRENTDRLGGLVNAIGPWLKKPLLETSDDEFEDLLQGNLVQAFASVRQAAPLLRANGGGRVVFFTFAGLEKLGSYSKIGAYAAGKTGLLSLMRSFALELAPHGITVNAIAPGVVESAPEEEHRLKKVIPAGRLASLEDIWQALRFLLSEEAGHVTGTNLTVSGGFGWQYP